jgi:K(+)-stimulated pyrophosphate-energized sodium pump
MPVHQSMREISDLIYETCKTYLLQQGKFLIILWVFISAIVLVYFGWLAVTGVDAAGNVVRGFPPFKVAVILFFSLVGMAGSYSVAWFGIRINTLANSRTAFACAHRQALRLLRDPARAGMSIGMALISVELLIMLIILLFIRGDMAGACFIGFAIGSRSAPRRSASRRHLHEDRRHRLGSHEDRLQDQGGRRAESRRDRRLHGRQRGRLGRPLADGFETYGVTGVALITFILLAVGDAVTQVQLLVWIFVMRVMMIVASGLSYQINEAWSKAEYGNADKMDFEHPLTVSSGSPRSYPSRSPTSCPTCSSTASATAPSGGSSRP